MKKTKIVLLTLIIGVDLLFSGCASFGVINKELIVDPDPANPFQGTWVLTVSPGFIPDRLHVINGMNGEFYAMVGKHAIAQAWNKQAVYTIEKNDNGFITSNGWKISVNGDILTVETMTFERYIKK
jgi:hypothetical protein